MFFCRRVHIVSKIVFSFTNVRHEIVVVVNLANQEQAPCSYSVAVGSMASSSYFTVNL